MLGNMEHMLSSVKHMPVTITSLSISQIMPRLDMLSAELLPLVVLHDIHCMHCVFTCLPAGVDAAHAFPQAVLHAPPELTVTRTTAVMAWTGAQHGTGKVMVIDRLQLLQCLTSFAACCGVRLGC